MDHDDDSDLSAFRRTSRAIGGRRHWLGAVVLIVVVVVTMRPTQPRDKSSRAESSLSALSSLVGVESHDETTTAWSAWKQTSLVAHMVSSDSSSSSRKSKRSDDETDRDKEDKTTTDANDSSSSGRSSRTTHHAAPPPDNEPGDKEPDDDTEPESQNDSDNHSPLPSVLQQSWESLVHETHVVWTRLRSGNNNNSTDNTANEKQLQLQQWWQSVMDSEEVWRHHLMHQLHKFGKHVQQWWGDETNSNSDNDNDSKDALSVKFQHWWKNAQDTERQWWLQTVEAYHHFSKAAGNKTDLWWNLTQQAAREEWSVAHDKAIVGANWTKYQAQQTYNWSQAELQHDWNWTQREATKDWNVTSQYVSDKEAVWWAATKQWFDEHYASPEDKKSIFLNSPLLYLNNSVAYQMLMSNYGWLDHAHDFFAMQRGWDVQANQASCGVASAAAVLNSLASLALDDLPTDKVYAPYPYATQQSILNDACVNERVIQYTDDFDGLLRAPGGLSLSQVARIFQCFLPKSSWKVMYRHLDDNLSVELVRAELLSAIANPNARVMVNIQRNALDQEGWGHMSPLGAYSSSQDAFLIMDVAKYKYPPVWVPTQRLLAGMRTMDPCGDWNYPQAQLDLTDRYLLPANEHDMHKAMRLLGCEPMYRGYIVVESVDDGLSR